MRVLEAVDYLTGKDEIQSYIREKDVQELAEINNEFLVNENDLFSIKLDSSNEKEIWKLVKNPATGIDYIIHGDSNWVFQASSIGEYFISFEKIDTGSGSIIESRSIQIFVENRNTKLGNIYEVKGAITELNGRDMVLASGNDSFAVYAPEGIDIDNYEIGDQVIVGIGAGETSYLLRFIDKDEFRIDEGSGLEVIRHIGRLERMDEDYLRLLINDYVLEIYHNDLVASGYQIGDSVFVEYVADYKSESNELIFIQKVE